MKIRGTCETESLFVTTDEQAMIRNALQKIVGKYGKQAGITGVKCSPHTLRHTFAKLSVVNIAGVSSFGAVYYMDAFNLTCLDKCLFFKMEKIDNNCLLT